MSVLERVRAIAAQSMLVRGLLYAALALSVTVGGVAAGALVVAPVVESATDRPSRDGGTSAGPSMESVKMTATSAWNRLDRGTDRLLSRLPEPVARYLLPTVAVLSITGALLALFLPPRAELRSPGSIAARMETPARAMAKLTPKGGGRSIGRKRGPEAIEALAASGASAPDIAWRTGLPLDAVQLLLSISTGRQLHPPTA